MSSFANRRPIEGSHRPRGCIHWAATGLMLVLAACTPLDEDRVRSSDRADTALVSDAPGALTDTERLTTQILAAEMALHRGQTEAASQRYAEAARLTRDPAVARRAVELAMRVEDAARAMAMAERWHALDPESVEAHQLLGLMQLEQGDIEVAQATLLQGLPEPRDDREAAIGWLGMQLQRQFPDHVGMAVMQSIVAAYPRSPAARLALGRLALAAERPMQAARAVDEALSLRQDWVAARLLRADIYVAQDRPDAAVREFEALLADSPDNTALRRDYASMLLRLERTELALEQYRRLFQAGERDARLLNTAATLAINVEAYNFAETVIETMRALEPGLAVRSLVLEGDMLRARGEIERSLSVLEEGLVTHPRSPDLRYGRALTQVRLGQVEQAVATLEALVAERPADPRFLNALGYTLVDSTSRIREGAALIEQAYALAPENAAIVDSMGWAAFRLGNPEAALDYLREAHALTDGEAEIAAHLGEVLWVLGERDEARAIWGAAQARQPDHPVLRETLERLDP